MFWLAIIIRGRCGGRPLLPRGPDPLGKEVSWSCRRRSYGHRKIENWQSFLVCFMTWERNWQFRIRTRDTSSTSHGCYYWTERRTAAATVAGRTDQTDQTGQIPLAKQLSTAFCLSTDASIRRSKSRTPAGRVAVLLVSPAEIDLCARHSSKSSVAWLCCSGSVSPSKLTYWSGVFHSTCHIPAATEHQRGRTDGGKAIGEEEEEEAVSSNPSDVVLRRQLRSFI